MPENRLLFKSFFASIATSILLFCALQPARAQTLARASDNVPANHASEPATSESTNSSSRETTTTSVGERVQALEVALEEERKRLDELQRVIADQQRVIQQLSGSAASAPVSVAANNSTAATGTVDVSQVPTLEDRIKKVEGQVAKIGPFRLSGDFRLRFDAVLRSASDPPQPALQHVQNVRARYRLRLNFDTDLYPTLSFHGQLASGPANNHLTLDQDFGGIAVRHPFFINEVWIDYHPTKAFQLQAGRVQEVFADNSRFLFDDDIRFNGFNERYAIAFKKNSLDVTSVELRAGQYILSNPNVAVITAGSPLATAGETIGTIGRSSNLFHQGVLVNQQFNNKWGAAVGADVQLYRHPN
ncbi:MAG TPA: putative porin, partial [Pyrinomonadaceae bacterium]|nr:putative porin [Pyrinomonadaceae bacterium]